MIGAAELTLAFLLDLAIGDPRWLPHPVRMIGAAIERGERFWRKFFSSPAGERPAGILLVLSIVIPVYFLTGLLVSEIRLTPGHVPAVIGAAAIVYLIATTIATRELLGSAHRVIRAIRDEDLESARRHVGMIVGRDTASLSETGVLKAAIETLAENLSDGVVAPLFYLSLGGLPLAMAYKAINTLDSMVGYKSDRYRYFGWAAARLDDAANFVPARISGLIIVVSVFLVTLAQDALKSLSAAGRAFLVMRRDGRKHPSPNSGIPEAAMAGALGVRLGGPSTYGGIVCEKPWIGDGGSDDYLSASSRALTLVGLSSVVAAGIAVLAIHLRGLS